MRFAKPNDNQENISQEDINIKSQDISQENTNIIEQTTTNTTEVKGKDTSTNTISTNVDIKTKSKNKFKLTRKQINILLIGSIFMLFIFIIFSFSSRKNETPKNIEPNQNSTIQVNESIENTVINNAKQVIIDTNKKIESLNIPIIPEEKEKVDNENMMYFNEKHNINFEYPLEWVELYPFELKNTPQGVENIIMLGYPPESELLDNLRITIENTPISITSKEYFSKTEERMKEIFPKFQMVNQSETTVSGREAPARTYLWVPQSEIDKSPYPEEWKRIKQQQIYVAGKTKLYIITFTSLDKDFDKNYKKYENILNTMNLGE